MAADTKKTYADLTDEQLTELFYLAWNGYPHAAIKVSRKNIVSVSTDEMELSLFPNGLVIKALKGDGSRDFFGLDPFIFSDRCRAFGLSF